MRVSADTATSTHTDHTATNHGDHWTVTWLPGRLLDQNQAITAMLLAEEVGCGLRPGDWVPPVVKGWAEELDMRPAIAVWAVFKADLDRGDAR
jgi:hypothetical protein